MALATQLSFTTMELLQNGLQINSQVTPLWEMRATYSDVWRKQALIRFMSIAGSPVKRFPVTPLFLRPGGAYEIRNTVFIHLPGAYKV